jgi:hypothetical protein
VNAVVSTPVLRSKQVKNTSSSSLFSGEKEVDLFSDEKERDKSGSLARCKNFSAQSDSDYYSPSKQVCSGIRLSLPGKLSTLEKVQSLSLSLCATLHYLIKTNIKDAVW